MKNNKSANDWLAELMESSGPAGKVDEVPEGWLSLAQMANQLGVSITTMNSRIQKLLMQDKVQRKKFRIKTSRSIVEAWHYNKA